MEPVVYRQFSVIGRLRQGIPCTLSTYEIIMQISHRLNQYNGIFTLGFSSPNFMIHFTSVQLQLEFLSYRTFNGQGFVLDIFPWSPEHEKLQLPWIIARYAQEMPKANTKRFLENLVGQPQMLHRHVSLFTKEIMPNKINLGALPERAIIEIENVPAAQNAEAMADFSYLLILELKDFYYDKFSEYKKCKDICTDIYNLASLMHDEINQKIDNLCDKARQYESYLSDDAAYHVHTLCGSLLNQMQFIGEEVFGLGFMMDPTEQATNYPINLTNYKTTRSTLQDHTPLASITMLRNTLQRAVHHMKQVETAIATTVDTRGFFTTEISYSEVTHKYISKTATTSHEAEATAIYRFLKYISNILGYSIVDANYGVLSRVVYQLNFYNSEMTQFYHFVNTAVTMIDTVHNRIHKLNEDLTDDIPKRVKKKLQWLLHDLEKVTAKYHNAAHQLSDLYDQHKRTFTFTRLKDTYRAKPDSIYSY